MPLHLFLAHFPVALLLAGAAADVGGAVLRSERTRSFAGVLLIAGGASAFLAFLTGGGALSAVLARVDPGDPRLEVHQQWGAAGVWLLLGAAGLRLAWRRRLDGIRGWIALAAALASAAVVTGIALSGAAVSHGG
jgi:uncharacterized membrane protein